MAAKKPKQASKSPALQIANAFCACTPDTVIVNDNPQSKDPEYFAVWNGGEWLAYTPGEIKSMLLDEASSKFPERSQTMLVNDAYNQVKLRAEVTLVSEWNVSRDSIPFADGVKSLCLRTGTVIDTPRDHMMLDRLPATSDEFLATDPTKLRFHQFMQDWFPDERVRRFVQRFIGQSLAGNPARTFADFFGTGRNGKGTLFEYVHRSFGPYSGILDKEYLTYNGQTKHESGKLKLRTARFLVNSIEFNTRDIIDEGMLNSITGNDRMEASEKGGKVQQIKPACGLAIHSNTKLNIHATSDGLRDRWRTVPCDFYVPDSRKLGYDEMGRIPDAEGRLVLRYWADGLKDYRDDGNSYGDIEPIIEATEEYFAEEDKIRRLLDAYCVADPNESVLLSAIWNWMQYKKDRSLRSTQDIRKTAQSSRQYRKIISKNSSNQWCIDGYRIKAMPKSTYSNFAADDDDDEDHQPMSVKEAKADLMEGIISRQAGA